MSQGALLGAIFLALHVVIEVALIVRVLLRPHREPASRIAWVVVIIVLPVLGLLAYLLLGETNIGRRRVAQMREVISRLPDIAASAGWDAPNLQTDVPECHAHLFQISKTVNGFDAIGGNRALLMADSNAAITSMVADIDAARDHVHLMFYIWLPDNNGCKVVDALKRAANRGVTCRAMADGLGSRTIIDSPHWPAMREAGVRLAVALPIGNPLLRPLKGRIDLRNHRKIIVIDNLITYCGSQNCADPEFLIKAKYAPWVDLMMRFEGPIARQNQYLFASDWESEIGEDISQLLSEPILTAEPGLSAQVIGTGPTVRYSAMPEIFETLMYAARHQLVITTPYYVPDESMQAALCASARRGVDTTIVFPARNDSWIVAAASRSYYDDLLAAGVHIFEYQDGLLHTKSLTLDGEITLIGSANMDRRSFELNYENNILFYSRSQTREVRRRQDSYIARSLPVNRTVVDGWTWRHRLWNNAIAMLGPVL
ncbi:MAG: cardiolipin synthase [Gammaproteobacteria bacterium]|nr:MAG: cardiolipin synthase [Gammaproteobacteria bacterium]RLA50259.1 MAG: cardiolipin synthase [Gammaproteobacteria bacterium]